MSTHSLFGKYWISAFLFIVFPIQVTASADQGLLGHWKLTGDAQDSSGQGHDGLVHGVDFTASGPDGKPNSAACFDGEAAFIEVPASESLNFGTGDFTLSVWVNTERELDDVIGDVASKFDPVSRCGFNWCIKNGQGNVGSQANYRNIQFGIDAGASPVWTDCGKPGNAVYIMGLTVHDGQLFAGICEPGKDETGHVYRYAGDKRWIDCGSPDRSNAVTSLTTYNGQLYAGTGHYRLSGSTLPNSLNTTPGGKIFRYDGDNQWVDCGQLPGAEGVGSLGVYRGKLYATSMYHPVGVFRHQGEKVWQQLSSDADNRWIYAIGAFNRFLYGTSWGGCFIYRYDGETWSDPIALEPKGQSYSLEVHAGQLYVGTWPNGHVWRSRDGETWYDAGRLGEEKEVMGMAVYNGKLYGGTLPLAQVYRYDDDPSWTLTGRLDYSNDILFRRAWSMSVFQGKLFCGVLPSGHVHALTAGANVSYDRELEPGWRHMAVVRRGDRLKLFVDGQQVAESSKFDPATYKLDNDHPLKIGFGGHDYFRGSMCDLRMYGRALSADELAQIRKTVAAAPTAK